jgi:dolichol-phosphate mannosyltransferase
MQLETETLWIVMPIYNEEASLELVLREWLPVLRAQNVPFVFAAINDGSQDRSLEILNNEARENPEIRVFDKPNSGHGSTCIFGFREALKGGADWVLQIDSDGQCDARYLPIFWKSRMNREVVMGFRYYRKDGWIRFMISRAVSLVVLFASKVWVWDPNVPYRLVPRDVLHESIQKLPADFDLVNVLLSARLKRNSKIKWIPIVFRDRHGGSASVKSGAFLKQGILLFKQLANERKARNTF